MDLAGYLREFDAFLKFKLQLFHNIAFIAKT